MNPIASPLRVVSLFALVLALPGMAWARAFDTRVLSETNAYCRAPAIAASGLACWAQISGISNTENPEASRTDIFISDNGAAPVNITGGNPAIAGRISSPFPFGDSVIFATGVTEDAEAGYQFALQQPELTDEMQQMSDEYPSLFGTPEAKSEEAEGQEGGGAEGEGAGETEAVQPQKLSDADLANATPGMTNAIPESRHKRPRNRRGEGLSIAMRAGDGTTTILTPKEFGFNNPVLGEDHAAFLCSREWPFGYELVVCDLAGRTLSQLTTNFFYVANPVFSGHRLAFQGWDGNDYEIYLHDFDTGETTVITENTFDDIDPKLDGDTLVWVGHPLVTTEIFYYDIPSGNMRKLSSSSTTANTHPSLWNGKVVWQARDDDGNDTEIFYFDGSRIIKLTSNVWDDIDPVIRDNVIAWSSYVDLGDAEIMALDLSDNIPVQLSDDASDDKFPVTAKGFIVWQADSDDGHSIICIASPHQE